MIYFEGSVSSLMGFNSTSIKQGITTDFRFIIISIIDQRSRYVSPFTHSPSITDHLMRRSIPGTKRKGMGRMTGRMQRKSTIETWRMLPNGTWTVKYVSVPKSVFLLSSPGALFPLFFSFPLLAQCSGQPASATILHRRYRRNISQQNKDHPRPLSRSSFVCPLRSVWLVHVAGAVDWIRVVGYLFQFQSQVKVHMVDIMRRRLLWAAV